ncbi:hypothetical protein LVD15_00020 [Fulvivirga maritima]|uniref:hypothetical protein n=1 Tax=Fulvivirga maritima TaxID=2904247 RepID=UPI001F42C539|nr:hypothetical protein [Fulvivirga maritima]UII26857.1 hypothetical protein LVD15_00020 [Fulvivirga maritima]
MANGRLYDAATMNEIGNQEQTRSKLYGENKKNNEAFDWHETAESYMKVGCSCEADH